MQNDVNNETGASTTGENPAMENTKDERSAAAQAPVEGGSSSAAAAAEEQTQGGDIDFGAILEQFEQEQTHYHAGDLVEGRVVGLRARRRPRWRRHAPARRRTRP